MSIGLTTSFQSTRPLRGATASAAISRFLPLFQSTRPLRGATILCVIVRLRYGSFQSTRPLRGATVEEAAKMAKRKISIHAPLAGRDRHAACGNAEHPDCNPRAPCGARREKAELINDDRYFNPRAPCGARPGSAGPIAARACDFNPRAPCGARLSTVLSAFADFCEFQSTRPLRGATSSTRSRSRRTSNFNPRAPCGARRNFDISPHKHSRISIHAPLAGRDDVNLVRP